MNYDQEDVLLSMIGNMIGLVVGGAAYAINGWVGIGAVAVGGIGYGLVKYRRAAT